MDLKECHLLGAKVAEHWYYVSKGRALCRFLAGVEVGEMLDVGAGSGVFARKLIDAGVCRSAVCIDPGYDADHDEDYRGGRLAFRRSVERVDQRLVLFMDVLEHVEDDIALLKRYVDGMPPGGQVLISVPAFNFLFSGHDVFLGHFRRYTMASLNAAVRAAGLRPVRCSYFFAALFPLIVAIRLVGKLRLRLGRAEPTSDLRLHSKPVNALLILCHDVERTLFFRFNRLFGLTVFCLARKPELPTSPSGQKETLAEAACDVCF